MTNTSSPAGDPAPAPRQPRPKGRPPVGKVYDVRLPPDLHELALRLGSGRLSEGIRIALIACQNVGGDHALFLRHQPALLAKVQDAIERSIQQAGWSPPRPAPDPADATNVQLTDAAGGDPPELSAARMDAATGAAGDTSPITNPTPADAPLPAAQEVL